MPSLGNNKVGDDDGTAGSGTGDTAADGTTEVYSLIKVVACYRHLASCVGTSVDSLQLRDELRQTREKAQKLADACRQHLTSRLRDKSLPEDERKALELLWVAFSSSLELFHADMCKVFNMGDIFSMADGAALVQTGLEGGGSEVAARALSLSDLNQTAAPDAGLEGQERGAMEQEIGQVDRMIEDMEARVNVLRWTVESRGPLFVEPSLDSAADSVSLGLLLSEDAAEEEGAELEEGEGEEQQRSRYQPSQIYIVLMLSAVVVFAATLILCIVFFT